MKWKKEEETVRKQMQEQMFQCGEGCEGQKRREEEAASRVGVEVAGARQSLGPRAHFYASENRRGGRGGKGREERGSPLSWSELSTRDDESI